MIIKKLLNFLFCDMTPKQYLAWLYRGNPAGKIAQARDYCMDDWIHNYSHSTIGVTTVKIGLIVMIALLGITIAAIL